MLQVLLYSYFEWMLYLILHAAFHISSAALVATYGCLFLLIKMHRLVYRLYAVALFGSFLFDNDCKELEFTQMGKLTARNLQMIYPGCFEYCADRCWDNPFTTNLHFGSVRRLLLILSGLEE